MLGSVGYGKSSLSKSYQLRQRVFGRVGEFVDPKGEYGGLVAALGGVTLRLEPGGSVRLNPLTRIGASRWISCGSPTPAVLRYLADRPRSDGY